MAATFQRSGAGPESLKRFFKGGGLVIGIIAGAADLTADLPVALPRWLSWLSSIPETVYDVVFFSAFLTIVAFLLKEQRERRRLEEQGAVAPTLAASRPETGLTVVEAFVAPELVDQLRAFHHVLDRAVLWAIDFLDAGICASVSAVDESRTTVVDLLREMLLKSCREHRENLDSWVVSGDWTESRFNEVISRARSLLNGDYRRLTEWIKRAGVEVIGEQDLVSMTGYVELRHRHWELFDQARRIRTHSRLGAIIPTLEIEGFFPGLVRQGSTTHIGMSAGELRAHVRSEGAREFIGREWSPERLTITGRQAKVLDCRTTSGYPILLPDLNSRDLDDLMQPGNRIYVWGTIKEVDQKHVLLSPAELIKVESA